MITPFYFKLIISINVGESTVGPSLYTYIGERNRIGIRGIFQSAHNHSMALTKKVRKREG